MRITKVVRFTSLVLLFLALCIVVSAQAKIVQTAHEYDYKVALDKMQNQEKKGIANADMYNQMGLCYYRLGNSGKAVVYFLRALRLNSAHGEAKNNLDFVINRTLDKEMYTPPSFLASVFLKVFDFFTLNYLAVIVLILLLVTVLCLHWFLHLELGEDRAVPVMWLVIFGLILLLAGTMLGFKYSGYRDNSRAVVIEVEVQGFSGPGSEFGKLFTIHEGLQINISRMDRDWALITLPNGGAGWIPVSSIERVKS
jgi:tetratricopeptide (TPR) repeat protein